jgi:hypothetical protein
LADARHLPHGRHQAGTATSSSTKSGTTSQLIGAVIVTVPVRWIPLVIAPCGTYVARPARTTIVHRWRRRLGARPHGEIHPQCRAASLARAGRARGSPGRADSNFGRLLEAGPGPMVEVRSGYVDRPVSASFGWWVTSGGSTSRSQGGADGLVSTLPGSTRPCMCFGCSLTRSQISRLAGGL